MSCSDCTIEAADGASRKLLVKLIAINGTMFLVEMVAGYFANSSGIIADSLDMLADVLVYGVSLYAIGRCSSTKRKAATVSGIFQLLLAFSILGDVVRRALYGSEPVSVLMLAVASGALLANAYCLLLLQKHRNGEVHMRASWIFSRSDVIANLGVILAAILVGLTNSRWPDLLIGLLIALAVIVGGFQIIFEVRKDTHTSAQMPPNTHPQSD